MLYPLILETRTTGILYQLQCKFTPYYLVYQEKALMK